MKMSKEKIIITVLILLVVALSVYFIIDFSGKRKQEIAMNGYYSAIREIVDSATNSNCEAFSVYYGEEIVNLINIDCLQGESPEE